MCLNNYSMNNHMYDLRDLEALSWCHSLKKLSINFRYFLNFKFIRFYIVKLILFLNIDIVKIIMI